MPKYYLGNMTKYYLGNMTKYYSITAETYTKYNNDEYSLKQNCMILLVQLIFCKGYHDTINQYSYL